MRRLDNLILMCANIYRPVGNVIERSDGPEARRRSSFSLANSLDSQADGAPTNFGKSRC